MRCERITITTDGTGAAEVVTDEPLNGEIVEVRYPGRELNAAGAADFIVTRNEDAGAVLTTRGDGPWSRSPRQATHDVAGAAALFAGGGSAVLERIPVDGYLKVRVSAAARDRTDTILVYVDD